MVVETLTSLPREVYMLLSAVLGGVFSIGGTFLFHRYERKVENKRLRKAIYTEILLTDLSHVKEVVEENITKEPDSLGAFERILNEMQDKYNSEMNAGDNDLGDDFPENVATEFVESLKTEWLGHELEQSLDVGHSSQVYKSNLDRIGELSSSQIGLVIRFYVLLEGVEIGMRRVKASSKGDTSEWHYLHQNHQYELLRLKVIIDKLMEFREMALEELEEDDEWERLEDEEDEEDAETMEAASESDRDCEPIDDDIRQRIAESEADNE